MAELNKLSSLPEPKTFKCPKCGASEPLDVKFCSKCGADIGSLSKETLKTVLPDAAAKAKKKKIIIISSAVAAVVLITGIVYFWTVSSKNKQKLENYRTQTKTIWEELASRSEDLKEGLANLEKIDDFPALSDTTGGLSQFLNEKIFGLSSLEVPSSYSDSYEKFSNALKKYKEYLNSLKDIVSAPEDVKVPDDLSSLEAKADVAKEACADFFDMSKYIEKNIPDEVFDVSKIKDLITDYNSKKKKEETEELEAAEKAAAEKVVSDFVTNLSNAYTVLPAGDSWTEAKKIAKKYWSTAGMSVFENDYLSFFASEVAYKPGKVVSSEKISDGKYSVLAEEKYEYVIDMETGETGIAKNLYYFTVQKISGKYYISDHKPH